MKKTSILLILCLMLLLVACGTEPAENAAGQVDIDDRASLVSGVEWEPQIVFPSVGGAGDSDLLHDYSSPEKVIFEEDLTSVSDMPVFINPYPTGQGGPEYDITTEMREIMKQNVATFLDLLYGDYDPKKYPFHHDEYALEDPPYMEYRGADVHLISWINCLTVSANGLGKDSLSQLFEGDLRQSPLLAAALDYLAIDDWQIECRVKYNNIDNQVSEYEYWIYQRSENSRQAALNREFCSLYIVYFPEASDATIYILERDYPQSDVQFNSISLDQALTAAAKQVPEIAQAMEAAEQESGTAYLSNINGRAVYSYDAKKGYIVPCWELYIPADKKAADGTPLYFSVKVPMINTTSLVDRL